MSLSIFEDKTHQPTAFDLEIKLGQAYSFWKDIVEQMQGNFQNVVEEWAYSGAKYGWSMRLCIKKRRIIYLTPCEYSMKVGMVLGQKAYDQIAELDINPALKELVLSAPKYGEGYGFSFDLEKEEWLEDVKKLIAVKVGD